MNTISIDKAGRIIIPKPMRSAMHLETGDLLEVELQGESLVLTSAVAGGNRLRKKQGIWVFHGSARLPAATTDKVLKDLRASRNHPPGA